MINQNKNTRIFPAHHLKSFAYFGAILFCLVTLSHCVSVIPRDTRFLLDNLDDTEKSKVITEKGISLYKTHLEEGENYQMLDELKEYFNVALRFDPENEKAAEYLEKIDNFITIKVKEKIGIANKLLKNTKRSAQDNYILALTVSQAYELDPDNDEIRALKKETKALTAEIIAGYITQINADLEKITEKDTAAQKSKKYITALDNCKKVLHLDPGNKEADSAKKNILSELKVIIKEILESARALVSKKDYKGASSLINICNDINKESDNAFEEEVNSLTYDLYYGWAQAYLANKDYNNALAKIRIALRAKSTKDALNLKKKITGLKQKDDSEKKQQESAKAMEKSLNEIDSLIGQKKYVEAYDKTHLYLSKTNDKNFTKKLNDRIATIKGHLTDLYDKALTAYKQENYKIAIELLTIIVHIDDKYKQAKDYLEKAVARQKLLDSF